MTERIFKYMTLVALSAVLLTIVIITGCLNGYFSDYLSSHLRKEADIIASAAELYGAEYFEELGDTGLRITLIASDGTVLYDSEAEISKMKNHSDREEVMEALSSEKGSSIRYSETLMEKTLYCAKRLSSGDVVRVSDTYDSVWKQIMQLVYCFILIFIAVTLAVGIAASAMAKRIVSPINRINIDDPDIDENYRELSPLLQKIKKQNRKITKKIQQLRQSREQFGLIIENMNEGIVIADMKTNVLSYNTSALRLLGAEDFVEGHSIYMLNRSDAFRECVRAAIDGESCERLLEAENRVCQIIANPSKAEEKITGIVVFILDVTEKQSLEVLRREFTSNVSHELKTPLTTIYGISDMLANGMVKSDDVQQFGGDIRNEAERMIVLINDIMALSKLDESRSADTSESVDIYDTARSVIKRLETYGAEKNLSFKLKGESVTVYGNSTVIDEIIFNLCDNAVKYNKPDGSVTVTIGREQDRAVIRVEDTGIGIASEHTERIFERFYRVDKSHSRRIKGTGLGLSIVKHGVKYHGGTVSVESTPGKGTAFTVRLPL